VKASILAIAAATGCALATDAITLDACQRKARAHHPSVRQRELIERSSGYTLSNANRGYLPQVSLSGKLTDQSDPAMRGLETDQSQIVAEISQTIWDGGGIGARKRVAKASATADAAKLETELYALRARVDQIFFGVLSIDEQLVQNDLLTRDLRTNLERVRAYQKNGIANQSDVDVLQVELLRTAQRRTELRSSGEAYRAMLSLLTGESFDTASRFERPALSIPRGPRANRRPELALYQAQSDLALSQDASILARNVPRLGAFLQLAYGKPGLVLTNTDPMSYWVAGLRLSWDLGGFYTLGNERAQIGLQRETIASRKEAFELDVEMKAVRESREIDKYRALIADDDEIIALRSRIKTAAEAKVAAGTMAVSDLVREVDAEAVARQEKILHEMQLLMAIASLDATTNDGTAP